MTRSFSFNFVWQAEHVLVKILLEEKFLCFKYCSYKKGKEFQSTHISFQSEKKWRFITTSFWMRVPLQLFLNEGTLTTDICCQEIFEIRMTLKNILPFIIMFTIRSSTFHMTRIQISKIISASFTVETLSMPFWWRRYP